MKNRLLIGALLACALPVVPAWAQPNELPFRHVSPTQAQALMPTKPITLHLSDVTLGDALQELQKQSGVPLNFSMNVPTGALDKKLSLDLEARSFQQAFDAIIDEAGVKATLGRFGENGPYSVNWNQMVAPALAPQSGVGVFQIQLQSLSSNFSKTVDLDAKMQPKRAQNDSLSVKLNAVNTPEIRTIGVPIIRLTRATDEKGRSLLPPARETGAFGRMPYQNFPFPAQLNSPAAGAQKLVHLDGEATYILSAKNLTWELPDILNTKGAAHEFESEGQTIRVAIENAQLGSDSVKLYLKATASQAGAADAESVQNPLISANVLLPALRIEDANGQVLGSSGYSSSGGNHEVTINTQFYPANQEHDGKPHPIKLAQPLRLIFDGPVEFVQTQVPFSFENVPLP